MNRRAFLRLGGTGLAGAALLGTGTLAGCGGSDSSSGLTVASWDVAADALEATIPQFKKKRSGVDVQMQAITIDYQQLIPRLQAGAGAPDVFSLAQQDFQNFLMRFPGEFVDVTDRMEEYTDQFAEAPLSHARKDGGVGALVTIYPFYWMATASTLTESEIFRSPPRQLPGGNFLDNLDALAQAASFLRALLNSIFVSTATTVSTVFLSALAGYAFAKFSFRGRGLLFAVVLATLMLPTEIMVVPLFIIMLQLGWVDGYLALIVPYLVTAFGVFLMRQQMMGFPNDLLDAARIDGNGEFGVFFRVVLPNMKAVCAALGIVTFMSQWGNFLWPLVVISTPEKFTFPLMLASLVKRGGAVEYGPVMVAAVVGLIPLIALFFFFQKYIVSGVFGGSLKE